MPRRCSRIMALSQTLPRPSNSTRSPIHFTCRAANPYVAADPYSATPSTVTYTGYFNAASQFDRRTPRRPMDRNSVLTGTHQVESPPTTLLPRWSPLTSIHRSRRATLIGDYTESATGSHSASTNGVNGFGQVIGYESRNSAYNTSSSGGTGVLGEESWLYTPGSGSQFLGLFGANDTYTATDEQFIWNNGTLTASRFRSSSPAPAMSSGPPTATKAIARPRPTDQPG